MLLVINFHRVVVCSPVLFGPRTRSSQRSDVCSLSAAAAGWRDRNFRELEGRRAGVQLAVPLQIYRYFITRSERNSAFGMHEQTGLVELGMVSCTNETFFR